MAPPLAPNPVSAWLVRHGWTQAELARKLDVPIRSLRRYSNDPPRWLTWALVGISHDLEMRAVHDGMTAQRDNVTPS